MKHSQSRIANAFISNPSLGAGNEDQGSHHTSNEWVDQLDSGGGELLIHAGDETLAVNAQHVVRQLLVVRRAKFGKSRFVPFGPYPSLSERVIVELVNEGIRKLGENPQW